MNNSGSVLENGDYKVIGHIAETGHIKFYVDVNYIPGGDLLKIEHMASVKEQEWENNFSKLSLMRQYEFLLNHMRLSDFLSITKNKDIDTWQKVQTMKTIYYNMHQ